VGGRFATIGFRDVAEGVEMPTGQRVAFGHARRSVGTVEATDFGDGEI
jgi:hypothetical protein